MGSLFVSLGLSFLKFKSKEWCQKVHKTPTSLEVLTLWCCTRLLREMQEEEGPNTVELPCHPALHQLGGGCASGLSVKGECMRIDKKLPPNPRMSSYKSVECQLIKTAFSWLEECNWLCFQTAMLQMASQDPLDFLGAFRETVWPRLVCRIQSTWSGSLCL